LNENSTHLKRLGEEEALLNIVLLWRLDVNVLDTAVATIRTTVLLQRLQKIFTSSINVSLHYALKPDAHLNDVPSPVAVLLVVRQTPHDEITLDRLGTEDVVLLLRLQSFGFNCVTKSVPGREELVSTSRMSTSILT
jgi:hypothetical protein